MAGAGWHAAHGVALGEGRLLHAGDDCVVELDGIEAGQALRRDRAALRSCRLEQELEGSAFGIEEHIVVGVAQIDRELGSGGHDVDQVGMQMHAADGCDLRGPEFIGQFANECRRPEGNDGGILAQRHRGGAGVVGLAGHAHFGPANALDAGDCSDGQLLGLQHRALLDMEFDERVRRRGGEWGRPEIADAVEFAPDGGAVDALDRVGLLDAHAADVDEAAEHVGREAGPLLVGEERNSKTSRRGDAGGPKGFDHLEPGQHAQVAVVAPTGSHGVDVGACHDGLTVVFAIHDADDVADAVDGDREVEITHPRHDQIATGFVLIGQGEASAPLGALDRADLGQCRQPIAEPVDIDAEVAREGCHNGAKLTNCQSHGYQRNRRHPG